jgi:CheY-like chemotaxis protein
MESDNPIEILLVEDNPGDVRLTEKALTSINLRSNLSVVNDGAEAISFLYRQGKYAAAPRPNLILLDLNLPKKTGHEVLAIIKGDPNLLRIPVVILTSSDAEQDILHAYNLHANSYVMKPTRLNQLLTVAESIKHFWLTVAKLPSS